MREYVRVHYLQQGSAHSKCGSQTGRIAKEILGQKSFQTPKPKRLKLNKRSQLFLRDVGHVMYKGHCHGGPHHPAGWRKGE